MHRFRGLKFRMLKPGSEATLSNSSARNTGTRCAFCKSAANLEKTDAEVREWEKKHAKEAEADLRSRAAQIANELASSNVGLKFCVAKVPDADAKLLQSVADTLKQKFDAPIVLAGTKENNVALVAVVPKQLTSKFQANKIIQQVAPIVGGQSGGRPGNIQCR